ncbi:hypothetical protein [Bradyrhizobium sp.]|uniref:hypothetical protein n=1 Tax=Bradyrhizobium sp. TaxID=376 RepID=UPI0039B918EA
MIGVLAFAAPCLWRRLPIILGAIGGYLSCLLFANGLGFGKPIDLTRYRPRVSSGAEALGYAAGEHPLRPSFSTRSRPSRSTDRPSSQAITGIGLWCVQRMHNRVEQNAGSSHDEASGENPCRKPNTQPHFPRALSANTRW